MEITKDIFIKYYSQHTSKETATYFNISKSKVTQYCHMFNFDKKAYSADYLNDSVQELYQQNKTRQEISTELKVSLSTVDRFLTKNNLKYRQDPIELTKDSLFSYYIIADHTIDECTTYFNVGRKVIINRLNKYNIKKSFDHYYKQVKATLNLPAIYDFYIKAGNSWRATIEKFNISSRIFWQLTKDNNWYKENCNPNDSQPNKYFAGLLEKYNISYTREFTIGNKAYDFKVNNFLIEIDPISTHNIDWSPFGDHVGKSINYHLDKTKLAVDNGFRCLHIWDWDDPEQIIKCFLLPKATKLYARQCVVACVDKTTAEEFLTINHTMGFAKADIYLGLYYKDELVSLMSFGKPRYNKNYEYELVRYCNKNTYIVVGGGAKLFKYFIKHNTPQSIISYCDKSKFNGDIYTELNFTLLKENRPSCHWFRAKDNKYINDNLLRKFGYDNLFGTTYGKNTDNIRLMLDAGFYRLYDCGQTSYHWSKENKN